jgi:hypothetical protein
VHNVRRNIWDLINFLVENFGFLRQLGTVSRDGLFFFYYMCGSWIDLGRSCRLILFFIQIFTCFLPFSLPPVGQHIYSIEKVCSK